MVLLYVVLVMDPLSHAILVMDNVLRNYFILESSGSTHSYRDGLSKTIGNDCGLLSKCVYMGRTCL